MPKQKPKERNKLVFVSDVHIGAGKKGNYTYDYDWLSPKETERFASFLLNLNKREDVKEVILLGDIADNWVCPIDLVPPTFEEIFDAEKNTDVTENLKKLAQNPHIKIIYMPGNHDMGITEDFVENYFKGMVFGGNAESNSKYGDGRLHAEHGSAYTMFNAPDPINDPRKRLPLGYFISRAVATKAAKTGSKDRHYWTYFDDLLEAVGPQTISESVFESILEESGIPEDAEIVMPPVGGVDSRVDVPKIKEKYRSLYDQWVQTYGPGKAFLSVVSEFNLGKMADNLASKGNVRIVIFGHNHNSVMDKDEWFVKDRIYANCGAWCVEGKPPTFVETEKRKDKHIVRLMKWEKNKEVKVKEESLKRGG
jgi:UDP-2,3-diacylglucosamine pyrophosphatase LpxH